MHQRAYKMLGSSPDPLAGFKGPISKGGMEGEGSGGEEMGGEGTEGKGRGCGIQTNP